MSERSETHDDRGSASDPGVRWGPGARSPRAARSTWHIDDVALAAYVERRTEPIARASIEAHLMACAACRTALGRHTEPPAGDAMWDRVLTRVEDGRSARVTRALRRFGVREPDAVVVRVIAAQALQWTIATTVLLAVAALAAALGTDGSARLGFVVLAPLLPPLGVAATFRLTPTSTALLEQTAPYQPARLLLWRTAYVLATAVPSSIVLGAIVPGNPWLAVAWLLPSAACTALVLLAATWTDPLGPAIAVCAGWVGVVIAWQLRDLPSALAAPSTQMLSLLLAAAAGGLFARRLVALRVQITSSKGRP